MPSNREAQQRIFDSYETSIGPHIMAAVRDESVTGIKVGADGKLFLKRHSQTWEYTKEMLLLEQRRVVLNIIASQLGKTINEQHPLLSGELPLTSDRVQGWGPPVANYAFVIRRHSSQVFTLDEYVEAKIMEPWQADLLRTHVQKESNIVVSGAVDSGKSTLLNVLFALLTGTDHVLVIEDTAELKCTAVNVTTLKTAEGIATLRDLVRTGLRADYNRIVIGETRGAEGLDLLKAWNMGRRGGFTTVHSDNAAGALSRFAQFCQEAGVPPQWLLMQDAIDLIVHIAMTPHGRKVMELMEVTHDHITERIPIRLAQLGPPQAVE